MSHRFYDHLFTPSVKRLQEADGSRLSYARFEAPEAPEHNRLTERESDYIARRDSFYMATVSATGWPYLQHRGGPAGFLKVLDDRTLGFADYRGNRQFVSVGNLTDDDRVALFLMDYPNKRRLKLLGHVHLIDAASDPAMLARLQDAYDAHVERGFVITVEGFDWNCPQHITERFTRAEIAAAITPLDARLQALEAENAELRAALAAYENMSA